MHEHIINTPIKDLPPLVEVIFSLIPQHYYKIFFLST